MMMQAASGEMAAPAPALSFTPMQATDIDEVMAIEQEVYAFPWPRGGFLDSLKNGDDAWVARDGEHGVMLGYVVQMAVIDEVHLLTIAVRGDVQGRGLGFALLRFAVRRARQMGMDSMLLEVRVSNLRALTLYRRFGFVQIGQRRNYYQAGDQLREDALILRYQISDRDE